MGISFGLKLLIESVISILYLYFTDSALRELYGSYGINIIGRFLKGEHPWLTGFEGLYMLTCIGLATSVGTGLWIGFTSRSIALLEGVIVGMFVTIFTAMTNMVYLYQKIEDIAMRMAESMGYHTSIGFMAVLSLQVMLYGFWSGLSQKLKQARSLKSEKRNSLR